MRSSQYFYGKSFSHLDVSRLQRSRHEACFVDSAGTT
jgi:hypothetical protein